MSAGTKIKTWRDRIDAEGTYRHKTTLPSGAVVSDCIGGDPEIAIYAADAEIAELRAALEAAEGDKRKLAEMIKIAIEGMKPDSERDAALLDLREFQEGQWWLKELDEAVAYGTDDQKRAVAVVRNMLHVAAIVAQQGEAQPLPGDKP